MPAAKKWTKDALLADAAKYKHRSDWCINSPGYETARLSEWFDLCVAHMVPKHTPPPPTRRTGLKDITGQVYGRLTAISRVPSPVSESGESKAKVRWLCTCECGRTHVVVAQDLRSGKTRSCGCLRTAPELRDLVGKSFGRLTILSESGRQEMPPFGKTYLCQCSCGNRPIVARGRLLNGNTRSCGCLVIESCSKGEDWTGGVYGCLTVLRRGPNSTGVTSKPQWYCRCTCGNEILTPIATLRAGKKKTRGCVRASTKPLEEITLNSALSGYRTGAEQRGLAFTLTAAEFAVLVGRNCAYCGRVPKNTRKTLRKNGTQNTLPINGIDRVDNALGYTSENCVSCCKICNRAKRDLSVSEWTEWLDGLVAFRRLAA